MVLPPGPLPLRPMRPPVGVGPGGVQGRRRPARARVPHQRPRRGRVVAVEDPLGGGAASLLEPRLDPVDRVPIAAGPLPPVPELRQALDGGLVPLQVETADQLRDGIGDLGRRRLAGCAVRAGGDRQRHAENEERDFPCAWLYPPRARRSRLLDPTGQSSDPELPLPRPRASPAGRSGGFVRAPCRPPRRRRGSARQPAGCPIGVGLPTAARHDARACRSPPRAPVRSAIPAAQSPLSAIR